MPQRKSRYTHSDSRAIRGPHARLSACIPVVLFVLAVVSVAGCTNPAGNERPPGLEIDLDRKGERELLAFYLGGYTPGGASDPFEAGLVIESGGDFYVTDSVLAVETGRHLKALAASAGDDRVVDWEEFERFILDTWPRVRGAPVTVAAARERYGDWTDERTWFTTEVTGSMSPYRRRISVARSDLRTAIDGMTTLDDPVIYPVGAVFVGEHVVESGLAATPQTVETTFMVKREDGLWDYFAYGADGRWTETIDNEPTDLNVPTQCVGCHFGSRQFEPERSFPAEARPGPSGPRLIHIEPGLRSTGIAERLQEHLRRSDTILGLYATLYLSRLRAADPGELDAWQRATRQRLLEH